MTTSLRPYLFILVATCVAFLSFIVIEPFSMRIDGDMYVSQITQFEAGELSPIPRDVALRAFKPFTGVWGSLLVPFITPVEALQLLNLIFLVALPFVAFAFLREIHFSEEEATWGALWITTGYPLLKYGLAIGTDLGSWLFALLTAYLIVRAVRTNSGRSIFFASLIGFIGGTIKEPGVFGLIFGGLYILFTYKERALQATMKFIAFLALPALILEALLIGYLAYSGFPTFLDWYGQVTDGEFSEAHYQVFQLIPVLASAFSILLVYALVGFVAVLTKRVQIQHAYALTFALLLASLPVLMWKIFISRVLFIQFLFFVPMALLGVRVLHAQYSSKWANVLKVSLYVLPVLASVGLFIISGKGSLFTILL